MKATLIPIDQAGRLVLPKTVREELAIKPGDQLKVEVRGAAVTLTPTKAVAGFIRKGRALVFSAPGDVVLSAETVERLRESAQDEYHTRVTKGLSGAKRKS